MRNTFSMRLAYIILVGLKFRCTKSSTTTGNIDFIPKTPFAREANYEKEDKTYYANGKNEKNFNFGSPALKDSLKRYAKISEEQQNTEDNVEKYENINTVPRPFIKRDNLPYETDEIFRELELELNSDNTKRTQTLEEEKQESDMIFQELLDETSTPKSTMIVDKQSEAVHRITDAIAKLVLQRKTTVADNINVLGVVSRFFNSHFS